MSTGAILGLSLLALAALWGFVEYRTLTDKIPDNHITAVIRAAYKSEPGVFVLFAFVLGYWFGHLFWCY